MRIDGILLVSKARFRKEEETPGGRNIYSDSS
jgi:hypothetical protein